MSEFFFLYFNFLLLILSISINYVIYFFLWRFLLRHHDSLRDKNNNEVIKYDFGDKIAMWFVWIATSFIFMTLIFILIWFY